MSVFFVTPAWQRLELSEVCFEQRRRVIDTLAEYGIEAQQVVIADDENLDIARGLGFDTVEQNNDWLGRRFNDGIEHAAKHGASFVVPIGSDSWIDPAYFLPLPEKGVVRTAEEYVMVTGDRMAVGRVTDEQGVGPYLWPTRLLAPSGYRPAFDYLHKGIDGSQINGIQGSTGAPIPWQRYSVHPFQYVGFRVPPFLTSYERFKAKWAAGQEQPDPWSALAQHYPADLLERARALVPEGIPPATPRQTWRNRRARRSIVLAR